MSLTLTQVPDAQWPLGVSGSIKQMQMQPGVADYPAGGYSITSTDAGFYEMLGATITGVNAAGEPYTASFVLPSGSFGAVPAPTQTMNLVVSLGGAAAAPQTPLSLGPLSSLSTAIGVASNVITVTMANTFMAGQFVLLKSFTAGGAINGTIVQIASASATQFTANYNTPNITAATADITGTAQLVQAAPGNLVSAGAVANITNSLATSSLLTMTCANSFVPGQFVVIQGLTNGATANGAIVQILTASGTQFTATWTGTSFSTGADIGTASLLVTSGNAPIGTDATASITNSVATASSAGVAGVITLTAEQNFSPGDIVVVSGLTNGAAINGDILVVNQAGLTPTAFVANHKTAAITTGADAGVAAQLVTGVPTGATPVSPGTDLSAVTWFAAFLGW